MDGLSSFFSSITVMGLKGEALARPAQQDVGIDGRGPLVVVDVDIHAGKIWRKGRKVFQTSGKLVENDLKLCLGQFREGCPLVE
jgi:hypothetical protein